MLSNVFANRLDMFQP